MSKNSIQLQKGIGIMDFMANYGTEEQCKNALFAWRWPDGFQCPRCNSFSVCKLHRKAEYQCNHCHQQTSLTSNTIFDSTKLPLTCWFLGIYLITKNKAGISTMNLHRQLDISYNAAMRMKHKLMQVMRERDNYRRFDMPSMIARLGLAAVKTAPMPERLLTLPDVQWKSE